jgi:hypothetical protein
VFPFGRDLLAIYVQDHLAGATLGVELARRAAAENAGTPLGETLESIKPEIEADRATLESIMAALETSTDRLKSRRRSTASSRPARRADRSGGSPAPSAVVGARGRLARGARRRRVVRTPDGCAIATWDHDWLALEHPAEEGDPEAEVRGADLQQRDRGHGGHHSGERVRLDLKLDEEQKRLACRDFAE